MLSVVVSGEIPERGVGITIVLEGRRPCRGIGFVGGKGIRCETVGVVDDGVWKKYIVVEVGPVRTSIQSHRNSGGWNLESPTLPHLFVLPL